MGEDIYEIIMMKFKFKRVIWKWKANTVNTENKEL